MSNGVVILTIPGIGSKEKGFSKEFTTRLKHHTRKSNLKGNFEVLEAIPFNATEVDKNQNELFRRLDAENPMGGLLSFRKFVLEAFGDGVAFERASNLSSSPYQKIHRYLRSAIQEANQKMADYSRANLVIVAASMGTHLLSTYIWDADHGKGIFASEPSTSEDNLKNLSRLYTIGSNIPLFVSGFPEGEIKAIDQRNSAFIWQNYYDQDDVLGWPLKQLSSSYRALVTDHQINTGTYIGSHLRYWKDDDFIKPLAKSLIELHDSMS